MCFITTTKSPRGICGLDAILTRSRFTSVLGLLGSGEEMGMEIVHDHIREQRRSGEAARAVESQERRALGVPDHYSTVGLRERLQVNISE